MILHSSTSILINGQYDNISEKATKLFGFSALSMYHSNVCKDSEIDLT